jgi:hypothetical protein
VVEKALTPSTADSGRAQWFWPAVAAATIAWTGGLWWFEASNPRLLASWHGFLHAAIASRFPSPTWIPTNPFFAGEPLAYYWFYQWVGHAIASATGANLLHAFRILSLSSLGVLVVAGALAGRQLYRSTVAALIIGYLALLGMNPLGPVIAAAKHVVRGQSLADDGRASAVGDVFVTDAIADDRMATPLLGALHIGTDWQSGQDIVWFFDVSSRAPAIALLMVMAWLLTLPARGRAPAPALLVVGALVAAFNPIMGFAVAGALLAAATVVKVTGRVAPEIIADDFPAITRASAYLAGTLLAWPTYAHMFAFPNPVFLTFGRLMILKAAAMSAGFLVLAPLAYLGVKRCSAPIRPPLATLTMAGFMLIGVVPFVELYEINQHNFANAASCLLAVPAAAWLVGRATPGGPARITGRAAAVALLFLPTSVGLLWSFSGRPPLPIRSEQGTIRRLPVDGALDSFYRWAQTSTPRDAVFITDPSMPVKMSGNVTEIPAFTGRTVFVDQLTYITAPYPDRAWRTELAQRVTSGTAPTEAERAYLRTLHLPVYVVTFVAADTFSKLSTVFGPAVFHQDTVAVFAFPGDAPAGRTP